MSNPLTSTNAAPVTLTGAVSRLITGKVQASLHAPVIRHVDQCQPSPATLEP